MAAPQQTVVVMAPTYIHTTDGDGQTSTGVTVTPQPPSAVQTDRYTRWTYLIFATSVAVYNFIMFIMFTTLVFNIDGAVGLLCGAIPALTVFVMLIVDSTVHCGNQGLAKIIKTCCCECVSGLGMCIPMGMATFCRFILWCVAFAHLPGLFWIMLCIATFDVGPLIICTIDWWFYYYKRDYNGLFGHKSQPLRCIVAQSVMVMIISWSFTLGLSSPEYDDWFLPSWPWFLHGLLSTSILGFCVILQFPGAITKQYVSNEAVRNLSYGFGVAQAILCATVWIVILTGASESGMDHVLGIFIMVVACAFYSAMVVPIVWSLFSIQFDGDAPKDLAPTSKPHS